MACPKVRVFRMRRVSVTLLFFLKKIHFMCRKKPQGIEVLSVLSGFASLYPAVTKE